MKKLFFFERAPKSQTSSVGWYVAMFDFDAIEPTDLSLKVGDRIMVLERKDDWWRGRCNGREGIFPANYVEKCETSDLAPTGVSIPVLCRARAVADFEATSANQLSLQTGDVVTVREKTATGWWEGEILRDGRTYAGWFPGDYVTPVAAECSDQNTATAIFDYEARQSDELSFRVGDIIVIVEKKDSDWWAGHKIDSPNVRGLFPANYVQMRDNGSALVGSFRAFPLYEKVPDEELVTKDLCVTACEPTYSDSYYSVPPGSSLSENVHYDVPPNVDENTVHFIKLSEELLSTEERYLGDLLLAKKVFHDNLIKLPYRHEVETVFRHWDDLIDVSRRIYVRLKKNESPGEVFISEIDSLSVFVSFCSHQEAALDTLNELLTHPDAQKLYANCSASIAARGMTLSTFLLLPLGRDLDTALQLLRSLVAEVNRAVTEEENVFLLCWAQSHIKCPSSLKLEFTSNTRLLGPRSFLHSGVLYKQRSGRMLVALLFNDFLLLTTPDQQLTKPSSFKISKYTEIQLTIYKQPMLLSNLKVLPSNEDTILNLKHGSDTICFRCVNSNARRLWTTQLEQAIDSSAIMILEQQQAQRHSVKSAIIGRLLVEVVNTQNISRKILESPPATYDDMFQQILRLSLGKLCESFEVDLSKSSNPQLTTQFPIEDTSAKFSLVVLQKNLYHPDMPLLEEASVPLSDLLRETSMHRGPVIKPMPLRKNAKETMKLVETIAVKFVVQLFDANI
ncbi:SH3 domain protein [Dictyocaulus viviparus]|uniref:SH3 domain protein n=1 Tax=Dictyocaulus viviparus TaxID=29172 RepID=A0A0D8XUD9_DICVI|nr:SH3 domain protein [Dictyocaulus viviparus]